jgi:hypothetical protein
MLKKAKIIKCYTKLYVNLSIYDISRIEDFHPVFKKELSLFISFSLAIKRVTKTIIRVIKKLIKAEYPYRIEVSGSG